MGVLVVCAACPIRALAGTLRIVTWNIEADIDGVGTTSDPILPGVGTVLAGIGEEKAGDNIAQAPDIIALEETAQNSITLPPILSALATDYPSLTYGSSSVQGLSDGTYLDGNGPNAMIYNQTTLTLLNTTGVGTPEGATNGEYRQVMRYEFQPVGGTAANDFYVYVSHMKSGSTSADVTAQDEEAAIIRANELTLPANSSVLYVGDFNNSDTSGTPVPPLETLSATGNGEGYDPASFSTANQWLSESATDLRYRDDYQLMTSNVYNDTGAINYLSSSFHNFGNNGSVGSGGNVSSGTALAGLTNPSQSAVLNALTTASDHLPVVADYSFVVPEPSTGLLLLGAMGIIGRRRR